MTDDLTIHQGDCTDVLGLMLPQSVDCIVTSPPYYALRDYGIAGQVGLEPSLQEYVDRLVYIFSLAREVLKDDGTVWLNLGDSFAQDGGPGWQGKTVQRANRRFTATRDSVAMREATRRPPQGLKPKDLMLVPARVALALQADGWWVRAEIIWAKPNGMPESVTDRPTRSHETIWLLSKQETYYYNAEAIQEPCRSGPSDVRKMLEGKERIDAKHFHDDPGDLNAANPRSNIGRKRGVGGSVRGSGNKERKTGEERGRPGSTLGSSIPWEGTLYRNKRDVWTVANSTYNGNHFATFPPELVLPCILAGSRPGGIVLDPFLGSGTTAMVALQHGRKAIGIELNPEYVQLARERCNVTRSLPGFHQ